MRKLIVTEFMTLDGVMQDPGGDSAFKHAGWSMPYWDDEIGKFKFEEIFAADAMLLGRVTYQGFAKAWPAAQDEAGFADRMNGMPKHVVSSTLATLEWNNSHLITGDIAQAVSALKQEEGKDILVAGSATLIQTLAKQGLIDEYSLLIYPVVLGSGKRLFQDGFESKLKLLESRSYTSGVVLARYATASA